MRSLRLVLLLALAAASGLSCAPRREVVELRVGSSVFSVEVARTPADCERGLMKRSSLAPLGGMLFVFDSDQRLDFWMKDTLLPLSIAFLSSSGKITEIRDMRPLSEDVVSSRMSCRYALEVNQGAFARAGVGEGDSIGLPSGFR